MNLVPPRSRLYVLTIAAVALVLFVGAAASAVRALGTPFPSLWVDPYGVFSEVALPGWGPARLQLRHPDRLVEVDGAPVPQTARYGAYPAQHLQQRLVPLLRQNPGSARTRLTFARGAQRVVVEAPVRAVDGVELWLFFGVYALIAVGLLWSGLVVYLLAGRRAGGRAYAFLSLGSYGMLVTFFDYHTLGALAPLFNLTMLWVPLACLWLGYAFPEPPAGAPWLLRGLQLLTAVAAALALLLLGGPLWGWDPAPVRTAVDVAMPLCLLSPAASVLLRLRGSAGRERAELRSALWGLLLLPLCAALVWVLTLTLGGAMMALVLPVIIALWALLPLSIGYALIRHNILATTSVLTRRLLLVPVVLLALFGASCALMILRGLLQRYGAPALTLVLWGSGVFVGLLVAGQRLAGRLLFPAATHFRPSMEQLSDQLSTQRGEAALREAVVKVVRRWLPTALARVLGAEELQQVPSLPPDALAQLRAGERVWTLENPWLRHLLVPMRSQGELRGVLLVAPKHGAALYTSEDLGLLDTIATLAAVALHNAASLDELERARRTELGALRDEKRLALGLLSAQTCHDIVIPLNYFRYLLKKFKLGEGLEPEDLDIGVEELGRLERMLKALQRLQLPEPRLQPVAVAQVAQRTMGILREQLAQKQVRCLVEVAEGFVVMADADALLQLLLNLLRNALQAAPEGGAVGVRSEEEGEARVLEVWDTGPGVPAGMEASIFRPWVTTKEGGTGLGLAISQRIVRSFGWSIEHQRAGGRTAFRIRVPQEG